MNENPAASAPQMYDRTSNQNNGTSNGSMTSGDSVSGVVGMALDFDGSNDYVNAGTSSSLDIGTSNFTFSALVKTTQIVTYGNIFNHADSATGKGYVWQLNGGQLNLRLNNQGPYAQTASTITNGQWRHIVGRRNSTTIDICVDAVQSGISTGVTVHDLTEIEPFEFGSSWSGGASYYSGQQDELRVSTTNRSNAWLKAEYYNLREPSSLLTWGTIEEAAAPSNNAPALDLDANNSSGQGGADFAATFTEDGGPVAVADVDATLSDVDDATLVSLTVAITNLLDGADELLAADTTGTSITASYDSGTGALTLTGADTVANYQQVLRTVTYDNSSQDPNTTARTITFVANDGTDDSNVATTTVTIVARTTPRCWTWTPTTVRAHGTTRTGNTGLW